MGREYLLNNLKQEVEEGKDTQNIIVLYDTGGMGKTQIALQYIHQHYKYHSSVFRINAATDQTTVLGFTRIMQRLIEHHVQVSGANSHIGRLLGMTGKLDALRLPNHQRHNMLSGGLHCQKIQIGFLCLVTLVIQA